ncbi:FHA domain-containing protein [Kangiella sediminilitoris]|uniref:FHA domain containing protein n=1 Tax=Kangiella sediminilitoris TaxID=1144748 RepID=A0A1B3BAK4_9GAMM|nr:FHA domain-containing protein [Kangiella sediminilitoris]AOE49821.1 FHA domain containing protein [Kangiella sediminilitoris]
MPARITACYPEQPAMESFLFDDSLYKLGRSQGCDVVLSHPSVSRQHATLDQHQGVWQVHDSLSANGLRVNGKKVTDVALRANDIITVGEIDCLFEVKTAEQIEAINAHNQWRVEQSRKSFNKIAQQSLSKALDEQLFSLLNLTGTQRGLVMLGTKPESLSVCAVKGMSEDDFNNKSFEGSVGAMRRALSQSAPVIAMDTQLDKHLSSRESIQRKKIAALACIPLITDNNLIGVVYVDSHEANKVLTELDLEILNLIAKQIKINSEAIVLQNKISAILDDMPEQVLAKKQILKSQVPLAVH